MRNQRPATTAEAPITLDDLNAVRERLWSAQTMCRMLKTAMTMGIEESTAETEQCFHDIRNVSDTINDLLSGAHEQLDVMEGRVIGGAHA